MDIHVLLLKQACQYRSVSPCPVQAGGQSVWITYSLPDLFVLSVFLLFSFFLFS